MMCDTIDVYVAHHCIHQSSNVLILSFFAYVCANIKSVLQCSSTRFANACNGATREHGERKNNEVQHTRNRLLAQQPCSYHWQPVGWLLEQRATITGKQRQGNRRVGMGPLAQANRSRLRKEDRHQGQPENVGTNTKEYTQLDNAIEAGSGAPMSPKSSTTHCPNMRSREICLTSQIRRAGTKTSIIRDHGRQCK